MALTSGIFWPIAANDVGLDLVLDAAERKHGRDRRERRQPAAPERDAMQGEAFRLDRLGTLVDIGCDMHLKAGLARRARHRQAVEQKCKVFADDVQ